jgi:hypothetical protein
MSVAVLFLIRREGPVLCEHAVSNFVSNTCHIIVCRYMYIRLRDSG